MHNTLESSKLFPFIAWTTVIGFALFTFFLTMRVNAEINTVGGNVENLQERIERMEREQGLEP